MPPINSPSTAGCPRRCAISPKIRAAVKIAMSASRNAEMVITSLRALSVDGASRVLNRDHNTTREAQSTDNRQRARSARLKQFVDRLRFRAVGDRRGVFEAAVERVVVADGGVVDAEGGVDCRGDILGADVAIAAPAVIDDGAAGGVGLADHLC